MEKVRRVASRHDLNYPTAIMSQGWSDGFQSTGPLSVKSCDLSIVMATHNASGVIARSLAALFAQGAVERVEVIVADSSTDDTPSIAQQFPGLRLLHFDESLTVPELRGRGIAAACGSVIAILDPFSIVAPNWISEVIAAHGACPHPVIGGAVDLHDASTQTLFAWAGYLNEYGLFMPPIKRGATNIVPGCNVSYKRTALFDGDRPRFEVFWKTFVNWEIQSGGVPLWLAPDVLVRLSKPVPFTDFLTSRFDHGRCFAGMRRSGWSWPQRLLRALTAPALPLIMSWRLGHVCWVKGRNRQKLIGTAPLQILLFSIWAAGEGWGYLRGTGRSCRRLFY
jgi:Glycosyl transferase family 2